MAQQPSKTAGKISAQCPHCGFRQLESVYAKSTFCRKCSEHYDLDKRPETPEAASDSNSLLTRFSKLVARKHTRGIRCYGCSATQEVSSSAKSSICPHCGTYIDLRDFKINTTFSRSIQTQGMVNLTSRGEITSTKVTCGEANVEGKLRGNLHCTGSTRVKYKGKVTGAIESHHLVVEKGSDVEFIRPIKVANAEIKGKVSARITADGVVAISKSGSMEGVVYAKSITVDKGGSFHGELYIGSQELTQAELLPGQERSDLFGDSLAFGGA